MRARGKITTIIIGMTLMLMASCVTPRRVNYLQDMTHGSQIELENRFEARIAPYDDLSIVVSSAQRDQELVAPFNVVRDTKGGYLVDVDGNIDFPVLGKMHVAGLTRLGVTHDANVIIATPNAIALTIFKRIFSDFSLY